MNSPNPSSNSKKCRCRLEAAEAGGEFETRLPETSESLPGLGHQRFDAAPFFHDGPTDQDAHLSNLAPRTEKVSDSFEERRRDSSGGGRCASARRDSEASYVGLPRDPVTLRLG